MPRTLAELHVHAWSACLAYRPGNKELSVKGDDVTGGRADLTDERLSMILRVWIESADISSYIVQDATALKLHCLFENMKLYMGEKNAVDLKVS